MCPITSIMAAWLGTAAAVFGFFNKAGKVVSPEVRRAIASWLRAGSGEGGAGGWMGGFADVLDGVFGKRGRSWGCFWRFCPASLSAAAIVVAIWAALRPGEFAALSNHEDFRQSIGMVFPLASLLNCFPAYAALLATCAFARRMRRSGSSAGVLGLLLANVVAVAVIALGALVAFKAAVVGVMMCVRPEEAGMLRSGPAELWALARTEVFPLSAIPGYWPWGIWFYATFFAPALAWLYAVAGATLRLTGLGSRMAGVEDRPLRSVSLVAVAIVSVFYCIRLALM